MTKIQGPDEQPDSLGLSRERLTFILQSLDEMESTAVETADFDSTTRVLLRQLLGTIPLTQGAIYHYQPETRLLNLHIYTGTKPQFAHLELSADALEELLAHPQPFFSSDDSAPLQTFLTAYNRLGDDRLPIELWVPLIAKGNLLGIIALGKKLGSGTILIEDIGLIRLLSRPISLAYYDKKLIEAMQIANFELNRKILELESIQEIGIGLTSLHRTFEITEEILIRAITLLDSRYGVLLLKKGQGKNQLFKLESVFGFQWNASDIPSSIRNFIKDLNATKDEQRKPFEHDDFYLNTNIMATPLRTHRGILGVLCVSHKEAREGFIEYSASDLRLLQSFGSLAAVALENAKLVESELVKQRLDRELELASQIQKKILPAQIPNINHYEIAATTIPCSTVGGDFYDFFRPLEQFLSFTIADVTGKGVPAALLVFTLHASLHSLDELQTDPLALIKRVNKLIVDSSAPNKFITCFYGLLDLKSHTLFSVNAGHNYPFILHQNGTVTNLTEGGLCLGISEEFPYYLESHPLVPGEIVVLYTDGVIEVTDQSGEEYGAERLVAAIHQLRDLPLMHITDRVLEQIRAFSTRGLEVDDVTLMMFRRTD